MPQGWSVNATTGIITFYEAPAIGADIEVTEFAAGAFGGTDVWAVGAWSYRYGYPSEGEFYGDRLWLAGTPADPQMIWGSQIGNYVDFGRSSPIVDSDAVSFAINSRQVNAVKDLIPLDNLLIMTTGGEYKMTGGQDDVVTPSTIGVKPQGNCGIGNVPAKVIGESAIFMQEEGQKARDLGYQFEKDGFRGNEISVWAAHLFDGHVMTGIEYWKAPWQVIWFTRDDGIRVGCTYMPEQEVIGWHWHDTDGVFLDTCCLPGTLESECYFLVERGIDGETLQMIELQAPTLYTDRDDFFFLDCGLTYDGRNTGLGTLTLTGTTYLEDDTMTLTSSLALFAGTSDVGDGFILRAGGESVRLVIDVYTDATHVTVRAIGDVPVALRNVATTDWTFQRDTIGGLWHLEGKDVLVLQDSAVTGPYTVSGGQISLAVPGGVVQVGLDYACEVETLELNSGGGESMREQKKLAYEVSINLLASGGIRAGGIRGEMDPVKLREYEPLGTPTLLKTGVVTQKIDASWGVDAGRVRIHSDGPLPMEILSIVTRAAASS